MFIADVTQALAVFAHPDDAEHMFGGTVARLVGQGASVDYVVCTDGANGSPDASISGAELAATRYAELRAAADVLGVGEIAALGYPNDELEPNTDLKRDLVRQIRRFRPEVILTLAWQRLPDAPLGFTHADHMAAAEATLAASYPLSYKPQIFPELLDEGFEPHRATEVWTTAIGDANLYVDVTDQAATKLEAIWCHTSQNADAGGDRDGYFERRIAPPMLEAGDRIGCQYAERFLRVPTKRE